MKSSEEIRPLLKDSAIIIAVASGTLYFFGVLLNSGTATHAGVPAAFHPDMPVEQHIATGLLASFFLLPFLSVVYLLDRLTDRAISRKIKNIFREDLFLAAFISLCVLVLSAFYLVTFVEAVLRLQSLPAAQVKMIRLADKSAQQSI